MKEKDKNNDRLVMVKITPKIEEEKLLLVPKGVEINQDILEKSWFFDDEWSEEPIHHPSSRIEFSEVDKELWVKNKHPILEKDGDITFDY